VGTTETATAAVKPLH